MLTAMILLIDLRQDLPPLRRSAPRLSAAQERTLLLAGELHRQKKELCVVCYADSAAARHCAAHDLPCAAVKAGAGGASLYMALRRLVRGSSAEILHVFGVKGLAQAAWMRRTLPLQLVLSLDDTTLPSSFFRRRALRQVDAFVVPSLLLAESMKNHAADGYSWLEPRRSAAGSGVPPLLYAIQPCALPVKDSAPAASQALHTSFLAFADEKDRGCRTLFLLLNMLARLKAEADANPCELRIAGNTAAFDELLEEARRLGVDKNLALLGDQDTEEVMRAADVVLLPELRPRTDLLLAAWSCQRPVLAPSLPAYLEMNDGSAWQAVSSESDRDGSLLKGMFDLAQYRVQRERLCAAGVQALKNCSPALFAKAHLHLYSDMKKRLHSAE